MTAPSRRAEWRQRIEGLTYSDAEVAEWCLELMAEGDHLAERLADMTREARLSREATERAVAARDEHFKARNMLSQKVDHLEATSGRCTCDPVPMSCGGEGPSETCELHGRPYQEWVERGDILNARLEAVKEVIAKARRTPTSNDPFRVALDIADDLEAAVYLEPGTWPLDHGKTIDDLPAALAGEPAPQCPSDWCGPWKDGACVDCGRLRRLGDSPSVPIAFSECCASGRCEVCVPGFDWRRDG